MATFKPSQNSVPGSTESGTTTDDTHQMTGSVSITGSLTTVHQLLAVVVGHLVVPTHKFNLMMAEVLVVIPIWFGIKPLMS
jgi:hypothetical protein